MSVSPSQATRKFESVFIKHAKDLDVVCTAPFDSLRDLCGRDAKGRFAHINGKKTYALGSEGLKAKAKERDDKTWTMALSTAAVITAISAPIFGALLVLGITAIIICLHQVHRYSTFQKHLSNEGCIGIQELICGGEVERFTPPNAVNMIPQFRFNPATPEARQYYRDIMRASLCEKSDPKLDEYIRAHNEKRSGELPYAFFAASVAIIDDEDDLDEDVEALAPAPAVVEQEAPGGYVDPNAGADAPEAS